MFFCQLVGWLVSWLAGWLVGRFVSRSVSWSISWWVTWLVDQSMNLTITYWIQVVEVCDLISSQRDRLEDAQDKKCEDRLLYEW